jgi:hypothetical protein
MSEIGRLNRGEINRELKAKGKRKRKLSEIGQIPSLVCSDFSGYQD